jgi:hypothetical protein
MEHPADRPLSKAEAAINAFRASGSLDEAEDAWIDFLHHWVRVINKYDAHGRSTVGSAWKRLSQQLRSDERLTYLWEARNTEEHTVAAVAGRTPAIALVNPLAVEVGDGLVVGFGGEPGIDLGGGISLTFSPGSLHLVPIRNRQTYAPPTHHDGRIVEPLELMEYGFQILRRIILTT